MYTLAKNLLPSLLSIWAKSSTVYAPQCPPGEQQPLLLPFSPETSAINLEYINFYQPVPDFSKPLALFTWHEQNGNFTASPVEMHGAGASGHSIFFGVRPCDAAALTVQDTFHLTEFTDPVYAALRQSFTIVSLNCPKAGPACFCSSTATGPSTVSGADLIVTELSETFLLQPVTDKGQALIDAGQELLQPATNESGKEQEDIHTAALATFTKSVDLDGVEQALEAQFDDALWKEITPSCISCSGCTQLCPTCTCFQVLEDATGSQGRRIRIKDSCQTEGFTRNAGWHNPRTHVDRVRYRIFDKLSYVGRRFDVVRSCTGCGRCITACPAHIDIVDIAETLKQHWQEAGKPAPLRMAPARYEKSRNVSDVNLYTPRPAVITRIEKENKSINRYFLEYCDNPAEPVDLSGQFYMLTVYGVGEIAISIPFGGSPGTKLEFCVKASGKVTNALANLTVGSIVGLRGPYGRPFPVEDFKGKDVLVVGSGVGLAPVRTIIVQMLENRAAFGKLGIIASAVTYDGLVYKQDLKDWQSERETTVMYALAKPAEEVNAHVGYINDLLPGLPFDWNNTVAILCASPRRIKAVASDLLALGMAPDAIYTSLETHMRCGVGKCGHCKVGSHYMCVDGPVFTYEEMLRLPPEY